MHHWWVWLCYNSWQESRLQAGMTTPMKFTFTSCCCGTATWHIFKSVFSLFSGINRQFPCFQLPLKTLTCTLSPQATTCKIQLLPGLLLVLKQAWQGSCLLYNMTCNISISSVITLKWSWSLGQPCYTPCSLC